MFLSNFIATLSDCHCKLSLKLLVSFTREHKHIGLSRDIQDRYPWCEVLTENVQKDLHRWSLCPFNYLVLTNCMSCLKYLIYCVLLLLRYQVTTCTSHPFSSCMSM